MVLRGATVMTVLLAAAACTPADKTAGAGDVEMTAQAEEGEESALQDSDVQADLPAEFIRTAWRIVSEDGARYTTYLDEDGRYRDFRNGDPWQEGTWETDSEDRLCFLPEAEGAVLRCWHPDRMQGANRMIASSDNGQRIRLDRADYSPPEDETEG
jgi:hypothetical protein